MLNLLISLFFGYFISLILFLFLFIFDCLFSSFSLLFLTHFPLFYLFPPLFSNFLTLILSSIRYFKPGPAHLDTCEFLIESLDNPDLVLKYTGFIDRGQRIESRYVRIVCVCVGVCVHVCVGVCVDVCVGVCAHVCVDVCVGVCGRVCFLSVVRVLCGSGCWLPLFVPLFIYPFSLRYTNYLPYSPFFYFFIYFHLFPLLFTVSSLFLFSSPFTLFYLLPPPPPFSPLFSLL